MEKINAEPAAVKARMHADGSASLVRVTLARKAFTWAAGAYFLAALCAVGGAGSGSPENPGWAVSASYALYPVFVLAGCCFAYAMLAHRSFVRRGVAAPRVAFYGCGAVFLLAVLPHVGLDVKLLRDLGVADLSDKPLRDAFSTVLPFLRQ